MLVLGRPPLIAKLCDPVRALQVYQIISSDAGELLRFDFACFAQDGIVGFLPSYPKYDLGELKYF